MTREEFIRQGTMGGPGLDGYAYNADVFCIDCGRKLYATIADDPKYRIGDLTGSDDPNFSDSGFCPQPIFFGESDTSQHCGDCGEYLYGPQEENE